MQNNQHITPKNMSETETVERLRTFNRPTFMCQHLRLDTKSNLGFNVPYDIEEDLQAWCDDCERVLQEEGKWTEKALEFAKIKPFCRCCFAEMKQKYSSTCSS